MKSFRIIAVIALLRAGLLKAEECTATNNLPPQIRERMDSAGYPFDQKHVCLPLPDRNSSRNVRFISRQRFPPFVLPAKKSGWSLWQNSNLIYVGRDTDQVDLLAPYSVLSQIEYDITYTFKF